VKIRLDECVPVQVRHALTGHDVSTVQAQGWKGIQNGELLAAAEAAGFALFILADKNLRYQQNLAGLRMAVLELWINHRPTLERHLPLVRAAAESIQPGEYRVLESP